MQRSLRLRRSGSSRLRRDFEPIAYLLNVADGLRHLEHISRAFPNSGFSFPIGYNFPPLLWVLQPMLLM